MKVKKLVLCANFLRISGSIGSIVSKNNRFHPRVDSHQPCEFHKNWSKTATCIVTVIIEDLTVKTSVQYRKLYLNLKKKNKRQRSNCI